MHPGKAVKGSAIITDTINGSLEIFVRGLALFSTIAYCSVHKPVWFSFHAEHFSENLLTFVDEEFQGPPFPLDFYIQGVGGDNATLRRACSGQPSDSLQHGAHVSRMGAFVDNVASERFVRW